MRIVILSGSDGLDARLGRLATAGPLKIHTVEPLGEDEVKAALRSRTELAWVAEHPATVSALTNLKTLAWICQAGASVLQPASGLVSLPAIADRLWTLWTGGSAAVQGMVMRLAIREAAFERSFPLSGLPPPDVVLFEQAAASLPLRVARNRLRFDHDLAADWARFQHLKEIADDVDAWSVHAANPLWTPALRLLGQYLLREPSGAGVGTAWDVTFAALPAEGLGLVARDILLDALYLDPQADLFLESHRDLLFAQSGACLARMLRRFHHNATAVAPLAALNLKPGLQLYFDAAFRRPLLGRWRSIVPFLARHETTIAGQMSSTVARLCETWLSQTPERYADGSPFAWRRELASLALATGRAVQVIDLNLAPDRTLLALVETGSQTAFDPAAPFEPQAIDEARHLRLVALDSNTVTSPLGEADIAPDILSWSPVGNRLLVWRRGDRSWVDGGLVAVDGVTGAHERFDTAALEPYTGGGVAAFNTVYADWLEGRPILYARSGTSRYDWFRLTPSGPVNLTESLGVLTSTLGAISDDRLLLLADGRPWSVAADGAATPIPAPPGTFRDFDAPGIMEPRRERLNSPPRRGWMGVRQADGCIIRLAPGRAIPDAPPSEGFRAGVFAGPTAVMERTVVNGVQTLTVRADGRSDRTLAVINERLRDVAFSRPDPVRQALPDGRTITSWLYRPPQRDGERLPLVVLSYPGGPSTPMAEPAGFNAWANPELVVGAGYAVLVPTLPLPFGEEPVSGYADRVLAVVDAALAQYPDLDGDRLAHWGHSFGGYIGLAVATQTDRFRSIIAVAGVSDLSAMWGEFSPVNRDNPEFGLSLRDRIGWAERSQGSMMAPPWVDPDRYVRNSPLFAADRIHVPVLLVHGDRDLVPLTQSQIMFSALWRQNKDARLLTYG